MTLFITFAPSYQYILAWATLHFPVLHHCISSVLCCKPNNHCAQGPKNDYTHAYIHPLSKPFITPITFLEPVSFLVINFPILLAHPIASIKLAGILYELSSEIEASLAKALYKKLQVTLHILKLAFYLSF